MEEQYGIIDEELYDKNRIKSLGIGMLPEDIRHINILIVDDQVFNIFILKQMIESSYPNANLQQA